jgi:hypothetical protein
MQVIPYLGETRLTYAVSVTVYLAFNTDERVTGAYRDFLKSISTNPLVARRRPPDDTKQYSLGCHYGEPIQAYRVVSVSVGSGIGGQDHER